MARLNTPLLLFALLGIALGQLAAPSNIQIFSTVINTPQSQSVVFSNSGSFAVSVSSVTFDGPDAGLFTATLPTLPATINQGAALTVPISFQATTIGVKEAAMILTTSLGAKTYIYLTGVAAAGLGGVLEPSLQYILAANRIPVFVGDNDPTNNIIASTPTLQNSPLLGDEISAQYFEKVDVNHPVSFDVLAAFGPTANDPVTIFGYYNPIGSAQSNMVPILSVSNAPGNNGQTLAPVVTGTPSFDPMDDTFGLYTMWPYFSNRMVYSEDVLNTWDNGNHHLRVYRYKNEKGITLNDTLILAWEEDSSNKDFNDIVLVARNIRVGSALKVVNNDVPRDDNGRLQPGWRDDLFTGFKIDTGQNLFILRRHFGNTFSIKNQNPTTPLVITSITLSVPTDWALYPVPTFPMTIAAGSYQDMNVTFIKSGGEKDRHQSFMTIVSDAPTAPTKVITLEGLYMIYPEDINELSISILNNGFGFDTNIYNPQVQMSIDGSNNAPLNGEEVRSRLWQLADSTKPLFVRKTGSFRQCCNDSGIFEIQDATGGNLLQIVDTNLWAQTILPMAWGELSEFTQTSLQTSSPFAMVLGLGGPFTSWSTNRVGAACGIKVWPLRDQNAAIVPNSYLVAQDFIWNGCGKGGNCDYNDNFVHIHNIKPTTQEGVDMRAKDHSYYLPMGDAALTLTFAAAAQPFTITDNAGVTTGFISVFTSGTDTNVKGGASYQASQITIQDGALNVAAQKGNYVGTNVDLVNGLFVRFDGRDRPFTVSANMKNLAGINAGSNQMAGISLGSNKQYFTYLTLTGAGNVQFYAEVNDVGAVVGTAAIPAGAVELRLMLVGDYRTNQITAQYEAYYATSVTSGTVGTYSVPAVNQGYFFGKPSEAGIYTDSDGTVFTVAYDDFAVTPGVGQFYGTLPTFVWGQFIPTASGTDAAGTSSSGATSTTPATGATSASGSVTDRTVATSVNHNSNTGSAKSSTDGTSPDSCGESLPSGTIPQTDTNQPTRGSGEATSPSNPTVVAVAPSDASSLAPLAVFLVVAIAITL